MGIPHMGNGTYAVQHLPNRWRFGSSTRDIALEWDGLLRPFRRFVEKTSMRRQPVLRGAVAAGFLLSGSLALYQRTGSTHTQAAGNYSGTIAWTDNSFPDSTAFGGAYGNDGSDAGVQGPLIDSTLGVDKSGKLFPDLATELPSTTNGGVKVVNGNEMVTVHLKPNQKWSDGTPITPQDYAFYYLLALTPDVGNETAVDPVQSFSFSGNDMTITYKGIYAPALYYNIPAPYPFEYFNKKYKTTVPASLLASYDFTKDTAYVNSSAYKGSELQKLAKAWLNDTYNSPSDIFNGPYKIGQWTQDQRVTEVPNPFYTALPAASGHPRPAQIQFVIISESGTAFPLDMAADSTYNNIDEAEPFRLSDYATIKKSKYTVYNAPSLSYSHLEFNQNYPPFQDIRVRQALTYAIDKDRLIAGVFQGQGLDQKTIKSLELSSFLPSVSPYSYDSQLPKNQYNPVKAKALLAAAGYATNLGAAGRHLTVEFDVFPSKGQIRSSQLFQRFWSQIGVTTRINYLAGNGPNSEFAPYADGGYVPHRRFQIVQFTYGSLPDPDQTLLSVDPKQIPDATHPLGGNFSGINDAHLVDLFLKARHTLDEAQRHQYYNEIQQYMVQQAYWVSLYNNPNVLLYKGTIGNFKPNSTQAGNQWNAFEWYRTSNYTVN